MTRFEFSLPDNLAQEAKQAGVLTQDRVEQWVRQQVNEKRVTQLFAAVDELSHEESEYLSPEEIAVEVHAMRAQKWDL